MIKVNDLKVNDKVNYGLYSNLIFKGINQQKGLVKLEDKSGNKKSVYFDLFEKYGSRGGVNNG